MKCDDCIAIIEEYLDDELSGEAAAQVRSHLGACQKCASMFEALKQEQVIYAAYQRDVDVSPAMWAAIEARIKDRPAQAESGRSSLREFFAGLLATPRLSFAYTMALVLIAIGATVAVMSYMQPGVSNDPVQVAVTGPGQKDPPAPAGGPADEPDSADQGVKQPGPETPERVDKPADVVKSKPKKVVKQPPSPEQLVREAEQKYLSAIAILTRDVNRSRSRLDPHVLAKFDNALASINLTIEETRSAARQNPDDPIALQYMLAAYSKKVDLLREMARN